LLAGLLVSLLAGCAPAQQSAPTQPARPSTAVAAPTPMPTILVGYGSPSGDFLMLWVGEEAQIFKKYGLNVESRFLQGNLVVEGMVGGEIQVAMTGGQVAAGAAIAGAPLVTVATFIDHLSVQIVGAPGITQPEHLRGKRIGTSGVGTVPDFAARRALRSWGLEPGQDATLLSVGPPPQQLTALQNGALDAAALTYPTTAVAIKLGLPVIADTFNIGSSISSTGLVTRKDLADSQPEVITNLIRGFLESRARILEDPEFAKRVLSERTQISDRDIVDATFDVVAHRNFKPDPRPTVEQMQAVLDDMQTLVPGAAQASAASMIDDRFVKRLEQDGTVARFAKGN
jgi:ABC-type nitrate/sulfonate/bicarbonate transport system substrate-binding protein